MEGICSFIGWGFHTICTTDVVILLFKCITSCEPILQQVTIRPILLDNFVVLLGQSPGYILTLPLDEVCGLSENIRLDISNK